MRNTNFIKYFQIIFIYIIQSLYCHYIILFNNKMPKRIKIKENLLKIKKISWYDKNSIKIINNHIKTSTPIIVKNIPKKYFEKLENKNEEKMKNENKNICNINNKILPRNIGEIENVIKYLLNKKIFYIAKLTGNYSSTYAHLDFIPSYTLYYLKNGKKKIILIPMEYSDEHLTKGNDSLYDIDSLKNKNWHLKYKSYYNFYLFKDDVLFFNNTSFLHKFVNMKYSTAFLIRMSNEYTLPIVLKNQIWNWNWAKYSQKLIFENIMRNTENMNNNI